MLAGKISCVQKNFSKRGQQAGPPSGPGWTSTFRLRGRSEQWMWAIMGASPKSKKILSRSTISSKSSQSQLQYKPKYVILKFSDLVRLSRIRKLYDMKISPRLSLFTQQINFSTQSFFASSEFRYC